MDFFDDGVVVAQVWAGHEGSGVYVWGWIGWAPGWVRGYMGEDFDVGEGCALGVDYLFFTVLGLELCDSMWFWAGRETGVPSFCWFGGIYGLDEGRKTLRW